MSLPGVTWWAVLRDTRQGSHMAEQQKWWVAFMSSTGDPIQGFMHARQVLFTTEPY